MGSSGLACGSRPASVPFPRCCRVWRRLGACPSWSCTGWGCAAQTSMPFSPCPQKHALMEQVAHQTIVMQFILELAKSLKVDPRACFRQFFTKIKVSSALLPFVVYCNEGFCSLVQH